VKGATNRDTSYAVTEAGSRVTARLIALRQELLMTSTRELDGVEDQLQALTRALGLLTGLYDHGARVLAGRR
jgi:predicted MarR family transcription regulator